jgi:carbamoyltransferase
VRVLGINAVFHDPAAAVVVDGRIVAAAEEERFSRRKHGKRPVPFSAWELPEQAMRWCLAEAGLAPRDLDAVGYSFDPTLCEPPDGSASTTRGWAAQEYARRAPAFIADVLPGLDPGLVRFVPHHVAHAASAGLAARPDQQRGTGPGRPGRTRLHLGGHYHAGRWRSWPHSGCRTPSVCCTRS